MLVAPPIEKFLLRLDEKYARSIKGKVEEKNFATIHSENNKIEDLRIYGAELTQETREGYNNLNLTKLSQPAIEKVTILNKKENEITLTSLEAPKEKVQQLVRFRLNLKKGTHYLSLKCEGLDGTELVKGISFGLCKTDYTQNVSVSVLDSKKITYTLNEDSEVFLTFVLVNINETDVINTLRKVRFYDIMISDKDADYEQYGVSPSMEYPSEVEVKSQTLNICNKNLYKLQAENNKSYQGINYVVDKKEGTVTATGTSTGSYLDLGDQIFKKGTYIVSGGPKNGGATKQRLSINKMINNSAQSQATIYGELTYELVLYEDTTIRLTYVVPDKVTINNEIIKPMIVEKNKYDSNEFIPHEELNQTITLPEGQFNGSMGEVKDCIRKIDDKWKLGKKLYKYVFTGDENWFQDLGEAQNEYRHNLRFSDNPSIPKQDDSMRDNMFCNMLKYKHGNAGELGTFYILNDFIVIPDKDKVYDLDAFKAKLKELYQSGKPMYVIYALAEPEYIDLPEETQRLLNELEILIGVNNISIDNGTFSFTYNKDLAIELENLQSQIDELKKKIATQVAESE